MQIDVKPLVWMANATANVWNSECLGYRIHKTHDDMYVVFYSSHVIGLHFSHMLGETAANAHHAAQVQSQVAGVRLSDEEAYTLANAYGSDGIQAAIAAMQVNADPTPVIGDNDGE